MKFPTNTKGFTLLEIVLVVAVMAIMSTAAIQSGVRAQKQFGYLAELKAVTAELHEARTHAVTHLAVPDITNYNGEDPMDTAETYIPPSYGIFIEENKITTFADLAGNTSQSKFDSVCNTRPDPLGDDCDYTISSYEIKNDSPGKYKLSVVVPNDIPLDTETITLFYQPTYAEFLATKNEAVVIPGNYIILEFTDTENGFTQYIVIFTKSGLIETFRESELADYNISL